MSEVQISPEPRHVSKEDGIVSEGVSRAVMARLKLLIALLAGVGNRASTESGLGTSFIGYEKVSVLCRGDPR